MQYFSWFLDLTVKLRIFYCIAMKYCISQIVLETRDFLFVLFCLVDIFSIFPLLSRLLF